MLFLSKDCEIFDFAQLDGNLPYVFVKYVSSKGRYFGLRSFASTIGGEVVNAFVAFGIGFWGLLRYHHIVALVASCLLYKSIASLILNPPTVLVVHFLKSRVVHKAPAFATFNPFHSEQDKTE